MKIPEASVVYFASYKLVSGLNTAVTSLPSIVILIPSASQTTLPFPSVKLTKISAAVSAEITLLLTPISKTIPLTTPAPADKIKYSLESEVKVLPETVNSALVRIPLLTNSESETVAFSVVAIAPSIESVLFMKVESITVTSFKPARLVPAKIAPPTVAVLLINVEFLITTPLFSDIAIAPP